VIGALVFDLDGTLVDSRRDLATAVNRVRAERGLFPLSIEAVSGMVGEGARVLLERALGPANPADFEGAFASFLRHYDEVCTLDTPAYPGVPQMLEQLAKRFPLAVLTNKPERMTGKILDALSLARYFRLVVGGDTLHQRKPDPQTLWRIARQLEVAIRNVVLVGDSAVDAATAQAAGSQFALVTWGFGRQEELAGYRPDYLCGSADSLCLQLVSA
jgi:phosphoglycolate phosphatase